MTLVSLNLIFIFFTLVIAVILLVKHHRLKMTDQAKSGVKVTALGLIFFVTVLSCAIIRVAFVGGVIPTWEFILFFIAFLPGFILTTKGALLLLAVYDHLSQQIEDRKRVEAQLKKVSLEHSQSAESAEQANRSKTEFLAKMSHELRTPLNAIIGFSSMIKEKTFGDLGDQKYEEYAGLIHTSGEHLLQIINDILDLSKVEAGKVELKEEVFCLSELAMDCFKYVENDAKTKGIALNIDAPSDICVLADKRISRQMVLNLLSNAIKFTPTGGIVTISVTTGEQTILVVKDTGVGMSDGELKIALEPFGQVENVMTRSNQGTGLGLVLVKNFIELHDGKMVIATEKGEGTSVCLQFPASRSTDKDRLLATI